MEIFLEANKQQIQITSAMLQDCLKNGPCGDVFSTEYFDIIYIIYNYMICTYKNLKVYIS